MSEDQARVAWSMGFPSQAAVIARRGGTWLLSISPQPEKRGQPFCWEVSHSLDINTRQSGTSSSAKFAMFQAEAAMSALDGTT